MEWEVDVIGDVGGEAWRRLDSTPQLPILSPPSAPGALVSMYNNLSGLETGLGFRLQKKYKANKHPSGEYHTLAVN